MNRLCSALFIGLLALMAAGPAPARADQSVVTAGILPGWSTADGRRIAGIVLDLAPGWKTYWRTPGETGLPPRFDWRGSRNARNVSLIWPRPDVWEINGARTMVYSGRVVIPIVVSPARRNTETALRVVMSIGVCKDVCVPVTVHASGTLPAGTGSRHPAIVAALADQPIGAKKAGVSRVSCVVSPARGGYVLNAEITLPPTGGREHVVLETRDPQIIFSQAEVRRRGDTLLARTTVSHASGNSFALTRAALRLTVLGRDRAVDIHGCQNG